MKLLSVFGTRPEAVKMAPILHALAAEPGVTSRICVTGQHRDLLTGVLEVFAIRPDRDLALMAEDQALNPLIARTITALDTVLAEEKPDRVIVHGDTTTALAAALAAFHRGLPVAHVEAGLRTYAIRSPWPEEANRRTIDLLSDLHFAPTEAAAANLAAERLHGELFVTGNSGVDALRMIAARVAADPVLRARSDAALADVRPGERLLLVTLHRRESLGAPIEAITAALAALARSPGLRIVWPLHPNPALGAAARDALQGRPGITLLPALDLAAFIRLMQRADLILTDSGGVQEEAVALSRPVLVARPATERGEAVRAGAARLVGTRTSRIVAEVEAALAGRTAFAAAPDLFGDGRAAGRIVDALLGRPAEAFRVPCPGGRDRLRRIG